MNTVVLTLSQTQLATLQQELEHAIIGQPQHSLFQAKKQDVTITAYKSGKVVFQGVKAEEVAKAYGTVSTLEPAHHSTLPKGFATWSVMGSDEVGTGSYFGPLTVCAAYVDHHSLDTLKQIGVKDSKNLTDTQIRQLATQLKQLIPYKQLVVSPEKYNTIHEKKNLNEMKALLHNQALHLLTEKIAPIKPQAYLIDEFAKKDTYYRYLQGQAVIVKEQVYFATKGESHHLAVAAASILARDAFLEGLEQLSQHYGYDLPSGAGVTVDRVASQILQEKGMDYLGKVAKLHFANTKKAQQLIKE